MDNEEKKNEGLRRTLSSTEEMLEDYKGRFKITYPWPVFAVDCRRTTNEVKK